MLDAFKIYIDQLRHGEVEEISENLSPDFIGINEEDLAFSSPVDIKGEAYLADNELILRLNIETSAIIPCSICNEKVVVGIKLKDFYHSEPVSKIKSGIFNFSEVLRDAILLETPKFTECNEGKCSGRQEMKKYFKEPGTKDEEEGYKPFENLKLEKKTKKSKKL